MQRISYVNGRYVPHDDAAIHIEDRGYQFSDGIYEVIAVKNNGLIDGDAHMVRLMRSLKELQITPPMGERAMMAVIRELLRRNGKKDVNLYIQVTRGVARRNHDFPKDAIASLVMTVATLKFPPASLVEKGATVIAIPDIRWGRRDIKSVSLLANILAKQQATDAGAREAWLYTKDLIVTEGSSSNAYIIDKKGTIITHPTTHDILAGITRASVLRLAKEDGIAIEERPFTLSEAKSASGAFLTSTTGKVLPVVKIDDAIIGDGKPHKTALALAARYDKEIG